MDRTDDDDVDLKRISVFKFLSLITLSTVQATGIAALHACFMRGNPPYCTQIPQEKHA